MSRISKNSLSVRQLVDLLDHPQSKTLPKKAEIVIDRDELKKQMRLKWKGRIYLIQIQAIAILSSIKPLEFEQKYLTNGSNKEYTSLREAMLLPKVSILIFRCKTLSIR